MQQIKDLLKTRHRYQSFSQKVANISSNYSASINPKFIDKKDKDTTFFYNSLQESLRSNVDSLYASFASKVLQSSKNLAMILYNKTLIFNAILELLDHHISESAGCIHTICDLIVDLSRDINYEFYPYFFPIIKRLFRLYSENLTQTQKSDEIINDIFRCMFFLFKFLHKNLTDDFERVVDFFLHTFIISQYDYTRRLAAEVLAFLIRQSDDVEKAHKIVFNLCIQSISQILKNSTNENLKEDKPTSNKVEEEEEEEVTKNEETIESKDKDITKQDKAISNETSSETEEEEEIVDNLPTNIQEENDNRDPQTKAKDCIETIGLMEYYEQKNIKHTLRHQAPKNISVFLCITDDVVYQAFAFSQTKISEYISSNISDQININYLNALLELLPSIHPTLSIKVLTTWIQNKCISDSSIAFPILKTALNKYNNEEFNYPFDPAVLTNFLVTIDQLPIYEDNQEIISSSLIKIINTDLSFIPQLDTARQIVAYSTSEILSFISSSKEVFMNFLPNLQNIIEWLRPSSQSQVSENLLNLLNNYKEIQKSSEFRNYVIPIIGHEYFNNEESYSIIKKLEKSKNGISLSERKVFYTLMEKYDQSEIVKQPPKLLKLLGSHLSEEDSLEILLHFTSLSLRENPLPDWLNINSEMFSHIFNTIEIHNLGQKEQSTLSKLLVNFDTRHAEVGQMTGNEILINAANEIFNAGNEYNKLAEGEGWITRLRSSINIIDNHDKLFDLILSFAKLDYLKFRQADTLLLSDFLKVSPQYGEKVMQEIIQFYPWKGKTISVYIQTLFNSFPSAHFFDSRLIELLNKYSNEIPLTEQEDKVLIPLITTLTSYASYARQAIKSGEKSEAIQKNAEILEQIDNASKFLLRSSQKTIRKSSLDVQFQNHIVGHKGLNDQVIEKIRNHLNAYATGDQTDSLHNFGAFLEEYKFDFDIYNIIVSTAVNLAIGLVKECLLFRKRQKKQYKALAGTTIQSLSFLDTPSIAPFIEAFLPQTSTPSTTEARQFCKFLVPMLSRIPSQLSNYCSTIGPIILTGLKTIHQEEKNRRIVCSAASEYVKEFAGHEETAKEVESFCQASLEFIPKVLYKIDMSVLAFVDEIARINPVFVAASSKIIPMLLTLLSHHNHEGLFYIVHTIALALTPPVQEAGLISDELLDSVMKVFSDLLNDKKFMKSEVATSNFIAFLEETKPVCNNFSPFKNLCIDFVLKKNDIRSIPLIQGMELSDEQFSDFVSLIASPLEPTFRTKLVPIVAEHLGDLSNQFLILNSDDLSEKTSVYQKLDAGDKFTFVFTMQAFADLQLNDFPLRSAAVAFLCRVINKSPDLVSDFILPTIERHLKKSVAHIPASEILLLLQSICQNQPELYPSITRISSQPFFLSLGSIDPPTAKFAFRCLSNFLLNKPLPSLNEENSFSDEDNENYSQLSENVNNEKEDNGEEMQWDKDEFGKILLPLLCQMSTKDGVDIALISVCKFSSEDSINYLMNRLIKQVEKGTSKGNKGKAIANKSSLNLLITLSSAHAFKLEKLRPALLKAIDHKRVTASVQLKLITALLKLDNSKEVTSRVRGFIITHSVNRKMELRNIAIKALWSLCDALSEQMKTPSTANQSNTDIIKNDAVESIKIDNDNGFFELFQGFRRKMSDPGMQPIMYICIMNMLEHTSFQGAYDDFLEPVVVVLFDDIFGGAAHNRTQSTGKPEYKKCVTFHSFELLARNINFKNSSKQFVDLVVHGFDTLKKVEQATGARKLIMSISNGFSENMTVDARLFVSLVSDLLTSFMEEFLSNQNKLRKIHGYTKYTYHADNFDPNVTVERPEYGRRYHQDLFIEKPKRSSDEEADDLTIRLGKHFLPSLMATQLLQVFIDKELFDLDDSRQTSLLNDLFEKLWAFTKTTLDIETLIVSFSILNFYALNISKFNSFATSLPDILQFLSESLSKLATASDSYGRSLFTLMTTVISISTVELNLQLPSEFTRALVRFCSSQLDIWESCSAVFSILRLVMFRRQDIPEIYDVADQTFPLMIRASSDDVRNHASRFCAEFLALYELSTPQVKEKLKFALANLSGERSNVRRSVLRFLRRLIKILSLTAILSHPDDSELLSIIEKQNISKDLIVKFQNKWETMLDQYAELAFVHLGVRLANETDDIVKNKAAKVTGQLMTAVAPGRFESLWTLMAKWASGSSKQARSGLLLLAVAVEYCPGAMQPLSGTLQDAVDFHIASDDSRIRLAALQLHHAIAEAFHDPSCELRMLPATVLAKFVYERETAKIGCEIARWYTAEHAEEFVEKNSRSDVIELCRSLLATSVEWHGSIEAAGEGLLGVLQLLTEKELRDFMKENFEKLCNEDWCPLDTLLNIIRVFAAVIFTNEECARGETLRILILLIGKIQKSEDRKTAKAGAKALEVVRNKVDSEEFARITSEITAEEEQKRKEKEEERAAIEMTDPEGYRALLEKEREEELVQMRKKKYMESTYGDVTLHNYGQDGKKVEPLPIAPEFR